MIDRERGTARLKSRKGAKGHLLPVGGMHVDVLQRVGILLEVGLHFHHHVILIELGEDGGDLALAEGVVEGIVDIGGKNAQARGGIAVDRKRGEEAVVELVGSNVAQFRERLQFGDETRRPVREFLGINIFQRVLELRARYAVFYRQVLHRLHERVMPSSLASSGCRRRMTSEALILRWSRGFRLI